MGLMPYTYPGDYQAEETPTECYCSECLNPGADPINNNETDPRVTPADYAQCGHAIYADGSGPDCGCSDKTSGKEEGEVMTTSTKDKVERYAGETCGEFMDDFRALLDADEPVTIDGYEYEPGDGVEFLNDNTLEVYGVARIAWGDFVFGSEPTTEDVREWVIVLGTGGPHVEVAINAFSGGATGRAYWSSDSAERYLGTYSDVLGFLESVQ